jgi:serine/threonine protein phosphatase PrpC
MSTAVAAPGAVRAQRGESAGASGPMATASDPAALDGEPPWGPAARDAHNEPVMQIQCSSATHIGRRAKNEDDCCAVPSLGLFAVADGMGGYHGGDIASRSAIATLIEFYQRLAIEQDRERKSRGGPGPTDPLVPPDESVLHAIKIADDRINAQRYGLLAKMGSTVALMRIHGNRAFIGHVGDSRVYVLRRGRLIALTRDHSYHQVLATACGTPLPPRRNFGHANIILRALGSEDAQPDMTVETVRPGDTFLLCTDGVHDAVDDDVIAELLGTSDVERASANLVAAAYAAGGRDNITAVVVRALPTVSPVALVR